MKVIKGDLVKLAKNGHFDMIVHGCNCFCVMGAGVALQIAENFPGSIGPFETDKRTVPGDRSKLGSISIGIYDRPDGTYLTIFNAYTQYGIAQAKGDCVVNYDAVRYAFRRIRNVVSSLDNPLDARIGYPMIGAGLAGGDWDIISTIIDEEFEGLDHTLVEYDPTV